MVKPLLECTLDHGCSNHPGPQNSAKGNMGNYQKEEDLNKKSSHQKKMTLISTISHAVQINT
jgi:hypothetical protein